MSEIKKKKITFKDDLVSEVIVPNATITGTLDAKIQPKHNYEVNWLKEDYTPQKGEVVVYEAEVDLSNQIIPEALDEYGLLPNGRSAFEIPRFKIGDGITNINELPFSTVGISTLTKGEIFNDYNNIVGCSAFRVRHAYTGISNGENTGGYFIIDEEGDYEAAVEALEKLLEDGKELYYSAHIGYEVNGEDKSNQVENYGKVIGVSRNGTDIEINVDKGFFDDAPGHKDYWQNNIRIPDQYDEGSDLNTIRFFTYPALGAIKLTSPYAHAEGSQTQALGAYSHSEGYGTMTTGKYAHTEGRKTKAVYAAHAEGNETKAFGQNSHTEGCMSETGSTAYHAHAEGEKTKALGHSAHSEGRQTVASGEASHAGGMGTIASGRYQTAIGKYNVEDTNSLFIIGNGTGDTLAQRSNALTIDGSGNAKFAGSVYANTNSKLLTETTAASTYLNKAKFSEGTSTAGVSNDYLRLKYGSFAFGTGSRANNWWSSAFGTGNITNNNSQFVIGKFNAIDSTTATNDSNNKFGTYAFIIGNGYGTLITENGESVVNEEQTSRSNAFTVDWNGNVKASGNIYANGDKKVFSEADLNSTGSIGTINSNKVYAVGVDSNGKLAVNVPWSDIDTHYTTGLYVGTSGNKNNAATANGNTYLKLYDNSTSRASFKISGTGTTSVTSDASGNITINSTDTNTHYSTNLYATTATGTAHAATTNGNTYLRLFDDSTARQSINIKGSDATSVTSDANGVITISSTNTDTKVTNTLNTAVKAYVTGTTSNTTNTGTQVFDTGVYLDTSAGHLTATQFNGYLKGHADTASNLTAGAGLYDAEKSKRYAIPYIISFSGGVLNLGTSYQ